MSGEIVVFCGPSIDRQSAARIVDATFAGPARGGDVYRAARRHPFAIALVDGLFDSQPAVFHKEILWALHEGIHVFGASSMGALRAAELEAFGMVGVGKVFEAFSEDDVTDDDDVAVVHLGPEHDWRPVSDAQVNIKATLEAAVSEGVVARLTAGRVLDEAKRRYYADRRLREVVDDLIASRDHRDPADLSTLRQWLAENGVIDQKRLDAVALLDHLAALRRGEIPRPPPADFDFSPTTYWWSLRAEVDRGADGGTGSAPGVDGVIEELRLDPSWTAVRAAASTQALARHLAERSAVAFDTETLSTVSSEIWGDKGLYTHEDLAVWMKERDVAEERVRALVVGEAFRRWGEAHVSESMSVGMRDQLLLSDGYPRLAARAADKRAQLAQRGLLDLPCPVDMSRQQLSTWWATNMSSCVEPQPDDHELGDPFMNESWRWRIMVNEYHYRTRCSPSTEGADGEIPGRLRDGDIVSMAR